MSLTVGAEAQTALEWAFGAYADKDPGVPFDIALVADMPDKEEITTDEISALARNLIQSAVCNGIGLKVPLGWCTFRRDGRFGVGVMVLGKL